VAGHGRPIGTENKSFPIERGQERRKMGQRELGGQRCVRLEERARSIFRGKEKTKLRGWKLSMLGEKGRVSQKRRKGILVPMGERKAETGSLKSATRRKNHVHLHYQKRHKQSLKKTRTRAKKRRANWEIPRGELRPSRLTLYGKKVKRKKGAETTHMITESPFVSQFPHNHNG